MTARRLPALAAAALLAAPAAASGAEVCPVEGVDRVLRRCQELHPALELPLSAVGCEAHRETVESLELGGTTYPWADWARWGEEIFARGFTDDPPAGPLDPNDPTRSEPIADWADYTCERCHNDLREDPILVDQDPDARYSWILEHDPGGDPARSALKMTQGVTMWGGVNRVRFYNGLFGFFDSICVPTDAALAAAAATPDAAPPDCGGTRFAPCVPGCRQMDVADFGDGIQVCSRYCGVGRFLARWEELAMLTHFWNRQVLLADVVDSVRRQLAALEAGSDPDGSELVALRFRLAALETAAGEPERPSTDACQALSVSYLLSSCETLRDGSPLDPTDPDCYRDWTPAPAPRGAGVADAAPEALPAMIRHLQGQTGRSRALPPGVLLGARPEPFVSDPGEPPGDPMDEDLLRGKRLYELSCGRCHGPSPDAPPRPQVGGRGHRFLAGSRYVFFRLIEDGLTPKIQIPPNPRDPTQEPLYMPEFTLQRLSYQQAEDIYRYLLSLPASGRIVRQAPR